jgi:hypothetical protein
LPSDASPRRGTPHTFEARTNRKGVFFVSAADRWFVLCATVFAVSAVPATPLVAQGNVTRRDTTMINRSANPLLANFRFRSIGPASMGGRIDVIAVYEKDPRIIWIGYAVGGVFKSTNAGTTFVPVFEQYGSASIGDIALDQNNPNIAYVGTGEPNNRQTSSFGDGIYKTTDGGKTFAHVGLRETQTIARVVLDPRNSNVVYVASPDISSVRIRPRHLQDDRRWPHLVEDQVRRREHRVY